MSSYSFKVQKVSLDEVGLKLLNMRQNKSFVWDIVYSNYMTFALCISVWQNIKSV